MHRLFRGSRALGVAALLVIGAAGCGSGDGGGGTTQNPNQFRFRTFNAFIPAAGSSGTVNVVNGATSLSGASGIPACGFSPTTGFQTVMMQGPNFSPVATGAGVSGSITPPGGTISLFGSNQYTVAVVGQTGQVGTFAPQILAIPNFDPGLITIPTNQAVVRVVNLSPDTSSLSLYNAVGNGTPGALGGSLSNVGYGFNAGVNAYTPVVAGAGNRLSLRSNANPSVDLGLTTSNLTSFTFEPGRAYTVFVCGQQNNPNAPLSATIVQDFP